MLNRVENLIEEGWYYQRGNLKIDRVDNKGE